MRNNRQIFELNNDNRIIGSYPDLKNSNISFSGRGNVLYCADNVIISDSYINFNGNNSIVYLNSSRYEYRLRLNIYNQCSFYMGKDNYISDNITVILSEQKNIFIGDNGAFGVNITMRTQDPHLIYSCLNYERINPSKSIYLGDHVWIGQDVRILKGTCIDSGSIVGAMSVVSGKKIQSNSIWVGNPCRQVKDKIFWDISSVHGFTADKTEESLYYPNFVSKHKKNGNNEYWIYKYNPNETIEWDEIENTLSTTQDSNDKLEYLINLLGRKKKNRFVHKFNI